MKLQLKSRIASSATRILKVCLLLDLTRRKAVFATPGFFTSTTFGVRIAIAVLAEHTKTLSVIKPAQTAHRHHTQRRIMEMVQLVVCHVRRIPHA